MNNPYVDKFNAVAYNFHSFLIDPLNCEIHYHSKVRGVSPVITILEIINNRHFPSPELIHLEGIDLYITDKHNVIHPTAHIN